MLKSCDMAKSRTMEKALIDSFPVYMADYRVTQGTKNGSS
jgi:hypothetical protein